MWNDLFSIGPLTVHGYGLMIAIGVMVALFTGVKRAPKLGLEKDHIYNLTFYSVIFGLLGAKLLYGIVEIKSIIKDPSLLLSGEGFVVYGGIIAGVLAGYVYCKVKHLEFLRYADIVLPSVAIAQGFGRIGCFLAGCCYGRQTSSCFSITFHESGFAPNDIKLVPTQLISSFCDFALAIGLILYAKKEKKSGRVTALYLISYSIGRSIIEVFRNDYRGDFIGPLSVSQFISIFILIFGVVLFFKESIFKGIGKQKEPMNLEDKGNLEDNEELEENEDE